jgi:hypothetical protein
MSRYVVLPWGVIVAIVAITFIFALTIYFGWDRWTYE